MKRDGMGSCIRLLIIVVLLFIISQAKESNGAAVHDLFFVVHCEADTPEKINFYYTKGLRPLVNLADSYGVKLTISLSPQWADYISNDRAIVYEIASWLRKGHEIGILHYGIRHNPTWDYYTNETALRKIISAGRDPAQKKGSMDELINKINNLLGSSIIKYPPAKQLSMNSSDYITDLASATSVKYLTDGWRIDSNPLNQDVVKKPIKEIVNGIAYWKLSMGYFTTIRRFSKGYFVAHLRRFGMEYLTALLPGCRDDKIVQDIFKLYVFLKSSPLSKDDSNYKFGLVTHPLDFIADDSLHGGCGYMEEWFKFIKQKLDAGEMTAKTVSGILSNYP